MKINRLPLSLISCSILLNFTPFFTNSARGQCVQADISVQYNISGSQQPTERTNNVEFDSSETCTGNVSVTTGVQGNEGGTGSVRQTRNVRHHQEGNTNNNTGVNGPTIEVQTNPGIDVYNPADKLNY
jgi:hypothetical protein